jgi:hypothetical protein|tara:strand:+ start:240 stop:1520 length:1281 start_codon:yes stop_codon:yes gene_type:complete
MNNRAIETEVKIGVVDLPVKFRYLGNFESSTNEQTVDFVGDKEYLRICFISDKGVRFSKEQALVQISTPARFLEPAFTKKQRREIVAEGHEPDAKVRYEIPSIKDGNLVFTQHQVPLMYWFPPISNPSDLAKGVGSCKGDNLGDFGLGYLLSSFKDHLTEAGWIDDEKFSMPDRSKDLRGIFLNKYHWFEFCDIPPHLYSITAIAEFESGTVAGVVDISVHRNKLAHKRLIQQTDLLEPSLSQKSPNTTLNNDHADNTQGEVQNEIEDLVIQKGAAKYPGNEVAAILSKFTRKEIASLGGRAKQTVRQFKDLAKEAAKELPSEMKKGNRRKLRETPDNELCFLLLAVMFDDEQVTPFREARNAVNKMKKSKDICQDTLGLWIKKLKNTGTILNYIYELDKRQIDEDTGQSIENETNKYYYDDELNY